MRKNAKKLVTLLFALALMAGCLLMTTEAKASVQGPEATDSKKGIIWNTHMRVDLKSRHNSDAFIYLANPDYYVASVKSSSKNLIAKATEEYKVTSGFLHYDATTDTQYKKRACIEFYAKKKGNYTVTVTIKNAKKKTVAKKKIKVFAGYLDSPVASISYGSTTYQLYGGGSGANLLTSTSSAKLKVKMNATYKLKKLEMATEYDEKGEPIYRKIKNGAKIKLATKTTFEKVWYENESYRDACKYNFLKPMTKIRVTFLDRKFGATRTVEYNIFNVK